MSNFALNFGKSATETSEMLQGASEEHITGRTHISYQLSEFKCGDISDEDAEISGNSSKAKQIKMLSKGTWIQKLNYYYLSSS
jgi:hypothetical protein